MPVVFERSRSVKHKFLGGGVGVGNEISLLQELVMMLLGNAIVVNGLMHLLAESALYFAGYDLEAIGIQEVAEIAFLCRGVLYGEEAVVKACLCIDSGLTFYPVG